MAQVRPPGGAEPHTTSGVDKTPTRKRNRQGSGRRARRLIEAKARERQAAWAERNHPNDTERLTTELNGAAHVLHPEGLFAEIRQQRVGEDGQRDFAGHSASTVAPPPTPHLRDAGSRGRPSRDRRLAS